MNFLMYISLSYSTSTFSSLTTHKCLLYVYVYSSLFFYNLGRGGRGIEMVFCLAKFYLYCINVSQCLIKKDKDDQNDATMDAFYEKLVTAYRDPALSPIRIAENTDGLRSPLLQGSEV